MLSNLRSKSIHYSYINDFRILMKLPRFCSSKSVIFADGRVDFCHPQSQDGFRGRLIQTTNSIFSAMCENLSNPFARQWSALHLCWYKDVLHLQRNKILNNINIIMYFLFTSLMSNKQRQMRKSMRLQVKINTSYNTLYES